MTSSEDHNGSASLSVRDRYLAMSTKPLERQSTRSRLWTKFAPVAIGAVAVAAFLYVFVGIGNAGVHRGPLAAFLVGAPTGAMSCDATTITPDTIVAAYGPDVSPVVPDNLAGTGDKTSACWVDANGVIVEINIIRFISEDFATDFFNAANTPAYEGGTKSSVPGVNGMDASTYTFPAIGSTYDSRAIAFKGDVFVAVTVVQPEAPADPTISQGIIRRIFGKL